MIPMLAAMLLASTAPIVVPDAELVDQDGRRVRLRSELLEGRVVAIDFVYTTCPTICGPLSAVFSQVRKELGDRDDILLLSISLDPAHDTPKRLAEFGSRFGRGKGWEFLGGDPDAIAGVIAALGARGPKDEHVPMVVLGDASHSRWERIVGIPDAKDMAAKLRALADRSRADRALADAKMPALAGDDVDVASRAWFGNTEVVDQYGKTHHFFDDLVRGEVVVVNLVFTVCSGACSPVTRTLAKARELLGPGSGVRFITITVDPKTDNPARLRRFADENGAGPGWYFLTGSPDEITKLTRRFGNLADSAPAHPTSIFIGDAGRGMWTRTHAGARAEEIAHAASLISTVD